MSRLELQTELSGRKALLMFDEKGTNGGFDGRPPGCFAERVWICLKRQDLGFCEWAKSAEQCERKEVSDRS